MRVLAGVVLWIGLEVGMTTAGAALMNQLNEQTSVPAPELADGAQPTPHPLYRA